MKLFLTSIGIPKEIREYFVKLLPKDVSQIKVAFIPTAANCEPDKSYIYSSFDELKEMGVRDIINIDLENENKKSLLQKFSDCDVIYVNGGNTYYLLDRMRKSGFDLIIKDLLNEGKIYVGLSAGSMVAGPDIESAGWPVDIHDQNIVNMTDTKALNLVPFELSPHFIESDRPVLERRTKEVNYPVIAITDKQAVLCVDGKYKIVGEGEKIIYNKFSL